MNTALSYRNNQTRSKGISAYQENQILNLSPVELILKLFDLAIVSIKKKDIIKANRVFTELITALDFDYQEIALSFFKLYRYCQDCLFQGNLEEPEKIMEELRAAWIKAFELG